MDYGIAGKTAMVTGAAQGIGRETALAFAREGCRAVLADLNPDGAEELAREIRNGGGQALAVQCDVSDSRSVQRAVAKIEADMGRVDILVNNAGVGPPYLGTQVIDMPEEHWDKLLAVHVRGAFLCTKYVAPMMIANGWGRIINMGSIHGISGGRPGLANYATAKAAVEGFSKATSLELAPLGVTVNCIAPGFVKTPMLKVSPEMEETMTSQTPTGRLARTGDIAGAILFLASQGAGHVTGQTLRVDGGRFSYYFKMG